MTAIAPQLYTSPFAGEASISDDVFNHPALLVEQVHKEPLVELNFTDKIRFVGEAVLLGQPVAGNILSVDIDQIRHLAADMEVSYLWSLDGERYSWLSPTENTFELSHNHVGSEISVEITFTASDGTHFVHNVLSTPAVSGPGRLILTGQRSADRLVGDDAGDWLRGRLGHDTLFGGAGHDELWGGYGDDTLRGGAGPDCLYGGRGDDYLRGGAGHDYLRDWSGDNSLAAGAGSDYLRSGNGNDRLWGHTGNDALRSGAGTDTLIGGEGNDNLQGEMGRDTLRGGAGNDLLIGGGGADLLFGGEGKDEFCFHRPNGRDTIADFESGVDQLSFTLMTGGGYQYLQFDDLSDVVDFEVRGSDVLVRVDEIEVLVENTTLEEIDSLDTFIFFSI